MMLEGLKHTYILILVFYSTCFGGCSLVCPIFCQQKRPKWNLFII